MFYARFLALCKEKGVSTSKAAIDAGFSKSTVTKWKRDPAAKPSVSGNITEEMYKEVLSFAAYVRQREEAKQTKQPTEEG